jgi:hypothetical protein
VAVAVLLAAARPALRELLRELLEQPQVGAAVGAIALRRPVEPAGQHAHSYRKVTTLPRCGPAALRAQHNVVSLDGPEHFPTVYAMTVTQYPSAADDQGPGSGVHVRTSGQGTQWHQAANVRPARRDSSIWAQALRRLVASSRSPRTRSSPTSSPTARSSSTASRWVTPGGGPPDPLGAASPVARAATRGLGGGQAAAGEQGEPVAVGGQVDQGVEAGQQPAVVGRHGRSSGCG